MAQTGNPRPAARRLPRDQRVAAILHEARAVLRDRGSEQFPTAEVAERCGVSEGTIYKYFPTKRDLLIQVAESWFEEFLDDIQPNNPQLPIRDQLLHVIWTNLSLIRREPALTRFVLMDLRADPAYRTMRIHDLNRSIAAKATDVVEAGVKAGVLRADIPLKLVRDMIFGAIEHQTWAYLRGEGDFSVDESAAGITDVVYSGIAVRSDHPEGDLGAAVARLERVTRDLTEGLAHLSDGRGR
jgi:AcrR family transcriptional regulator